MSSLTALWLPCWRDHMCGFQSSGLPHPTSHIKAWTFEWYDLFGILVHWPGIEPRPIAVRAPSPNHWTTKEFPLYFEITCVCYTIASWEDVLVFCCLCNKWPQTSWLKKHRLTILQFCRREVQHWPNWANIELSALFSPGCPRAASTSSPFPSSRGHPHSLAHGPVYLSSKPATLHHCAFLL